MKPLNSISNIEDAIWTLASLDGWLTSQLQSYSEDSMANEPGQNPLLVKISNGKQ